MASKGLAARNSLKSRQSSHGTIEGIMLWAWPQTVGWDEMQSRLTMAVAGLANLATGWRLRQAARVLEGAGLAIDEIRAIRAC
jgi:hypothetical protein